MPLHLLGKKSWNVYNSANIERVRRDEAEAKAKEEAEEQRMQEEDAQRRIALLRGEAPPTPSTVVATDTSTHHRHRHEHDRKRKRRRGEDDTDRDIRYAQQDTEANAKAAHALLKDSDRAAPLHDHAGNIQLIPAPDEAALRKAEKNAEVEAEKAKKRKREEEQHTMRFSNAAGFSQRMAQPWYTSNRPVSAHSKPSDLVLDSVQSKDVWGNEDPLRKERERNRISSTDPLAAMKQAQRQLKNSVREREAWSIQRKAELDGLDGISRKERKQSGMRHRREKDRDSIDGFSLDADGESRSRRSGHGRHRKEHGHGHRQRSHSRARVGVSSQISHE